MRLQTLITVLASGLAWAQQAPVTDSERVVAVLRKGDPLVDGKLGTELLASGSLDDAIFAVARSEALDRTTRLRALRLVRALDRAAFVRSAPRRDLDWWLALQETAREVPEAVAPCLLRRAFAEEGACSAALQELDAAAEVATRFCDEWNELGEAKEAAKYDALEAELEQSAPAVVPALFRLLCVPACIAFSGPQQGQPVTARQQVRAILGLAAVLECKQALPFFVMHAAGPSLTQASHAAMAVQRFSGESFGAAFMVEARDAGLLAWWQKHTTEHRAVLDYIHHRTLQWARAAIEGSAPKPADCAWGAVGSLQRAAGDGRAVRLEDGVEAMRTRLEEIEAAWVLAKH